MVNGQGPFRFIIDTGANRTAVSPTVVQQLGLVTIGEGEVHSVHDVVMAPLVNVGSLTFGDVSLSSQSAPVLGGVMLAGMEGLLGVDALGGRVLRMDFRRRCVEIVPAHNTRRLSSWARLHGDLRFGRLLVVSGRIGAERMNVLIDTGSDSTLANVALRERLRTRYRVDVRGLEAVRAYTAGHPIVLDSVLAIPQISIGGLEARNITAYIGDFHIFQVWGLQHEPTMLIGMDVLSQTDAMAIDYESGTVYFQLRNRAHTGSRLSDLHSNPTLSMSHGPR